MLVSPKAFAKLAKIEAIGNAKEVNVLRNGKVLLLKNGAQLLAGDTISTLDYGVDLRFSNRSLVRLGRNTKYQLGEDKKSDSVVDELQKGFIRILVPAAKQKKNHYRLNTPTGTIGVRGTELAVSVDDAMTTLHVLHGTVAFATIGEDLNKSTKIVMVMRGYFSHINANEKKPSTPKAFNLKEFIQKIESNSSKNAFLDLVARKNSANDFVKNANTEEKGRKSLFQASENKKNKFNGNETETTADQIIDLKKDLLQAVRDDKVDVVLEILEKIGEEGVWISTGDSILHVAAVYDSTQTIQFLIDRGLSVDIKNSNDDTPLMYVAGKSGVVKTATLLLQNGADPLLENKDGESALDMAKSAKREEMIKLLESNVEKQKDD